MNRNTLWAETFVDELARSGLRAVCAAPGSRHTPLMLAFAKHQAIRVYSHLDERSAAFFALGMALGTDSPVALICSSGTAGANMLPAVIEAHQSRVPLIVITADRPHELRHSGANQTIDQIKLFGDFALWFVDAALPESNPPAIAVRNLRTLANRAVARANGERKGVVHINMPFRKPLEPTPVPTDIVQVPNSADSRDENNPYTQIMSAGRQVDSQQVEIVARFIEEHHRGVIVCGGRIGDTLHSLAALSEIAHYPVIAESSSLIRHSTEGVLGGYDNYLSDLPHPDVILHYGDAAISNPLGRFIADHPSATHIRITKDGVWSDDHHVTEYWIHTEPGAFTTALVQQLNGLERNDDTLLQAYLQTEAAAWEAIADHLDNLPYFDGAVAYDVVDLMPENSILFAGNSLAVRHLDQFGKPTQKHLLTYANRGASGIDGNISTALGVGAAYPGRSLVALVGDITFYHDMNGLLAIRRCGIPVTIVLLSNDGGGIFRRLPIRDFEPEFSDYFLTAHGLNFSHAAHLYGLGYVQIDATSSDARQRFRDTFRAQITSGSSTIIEVQTDSAADEERRQTVLRAVRGRIEDLKSDL